MIGTPYQIAATALLTSPTTGWIHMMVSYSGQSNAETIEIYINGVLMASSNDTSNHPHGTGNGQIVLGRYYTNSHQLYQNVMLDELAFFNTALSEQSAAMLYNAA